MKYPKIDSKDQAAELTISLLSDLFKGKDLQNVGFHLWNGKRWPDDNPRPTTIVLNHPGSLRSMFLPGTEVGFGEAYIYNNFDVEGNLEAIFGLAEEMTQDVCGDTRWSSSWRLWFC